VEGASIHGPAVHNRRPALPIALKEELEVSAPMNKLVVVLSVAVASLGGTTIFLWQQLGKERARTADLQSRVESAESTQRMFAQRFAQRAEPAAAAPAVPGAAPVAPNAGAASRRPAANPEQAQAVRSAIQGLLSRPEIQQAARALTPLNYPGLAKELNLSPDEEKKLLDLLAKRQSAQTMNLIGAIGGDPAEARRNADEQRRAVDGEIATLLGNRYPQYQEYDRTLPTRRQVEQLQTALGANDKLSDSQTRPLITALSAEQQRIQQEQQSQPRTQIALNASPEERAQQLQQMQQRTAGNNQRLVAAATPYMNPQQLDAYKKQLERGGGAGGLAGMMGAGAGGFGGARGPAGARAPGGTAPAN
jgi:hypothetical protein